MSQASPSKEPSMDEILASIRRIIESSDEKSGGGSAMAARMANADRAVASRDAAPDRPASFALPTQAARVVPFADRSPSSAVPESEAADDSDERWVPMTEPANTAGEPPVAEKAEAAADISEPMSSEASVEPVAASDRWARELDDVGSWSVLDVTTKVDNSSEASVTEPAVDAKAEPVDLLANKEPVEPEAQKALEPELEAMVPAVEPEVAVADAAEAEDDFLVDFNEADFVEALDRNAALASAREEAADEPQAGGVPDRTVEASAPTVDVSERTALPSFLGARAAQASVADVEPAVVPRPSVVRQASALMSEEAGTQVAAAFDDLSRAIRDGQMKSMEEMAREMLRPMLQEWLDDNLPRLVERLVREEIERVSRGSSR